MKMLKNTAAGFLFGTAAITVLASNAIAAGPGAPAKSIEGVWKGDFGAGEWTVKLQSADGAWTGHYTYPAYDAWNPVTNLRASANSAKFTIKAKSSVAFDLDLADRGNELKGSVTFSGGKKSSKRPITIPVSFARQ